MCDEEADEHVQHIASDWTSAALSDPDKALCRFADKLTASPQEMMNRDIEDLRAAGFDDVAIHDAAQVVGYFNYINRVADALNVDLEDFVKPWGES